MTTLLSAKNISVTLGSRKILDNISLDMNEGDLKVLNWSFWSRKKYTFTMHKSSYCPRSRGNLS